MAGDMEFQRKLQFMRRKAYIFIVVSMLFAGCRGWDVPEFGSDEPLPNLTIGQLRDYCGGAELTFADDIVITGRVVSNDRAGNFYNTFFIDDGTGAVEIMAGMPDLHVSYREGQFVSVRARGLAAGWSNGAMQLGLPPEPGSGFATGYFYHPAVIRQYVSRGRSVEAVEPLSVAAGSLDESMCGRLVGIGGLYPDPAGTSATWATVEPSPETGYRKFYTADRLDSVTVVTSGYARFAGHPLPAGETSLTGILLYGKGGTSKNHYLIKLRDEKDIDY